jgi:hypothetical protein
MVVDEPAAREDYLRTSETSVKNYSEKSELAE